MVFNTTSLLILMEARLLRYSLVLDLILLEHQRKNRKSYYNCLNNTDIKIIFTSKSETNLREVPIYVKSRIVTS